MYVKMKKYVTVCVLFITVAVQSQQQVSLKITVSVAPAMRAAFQRGGRLLFHLTSQHEREPRNRSEVTIGVTPENWDGENDFVINTHKRNVLFTGMQKLRDHLSEKYYYQITYKQNMDDGNENVPGNLYSEVDSFSLTSAASLHLRLSKIVPPTVIVDHPFVKVVTVESKYLSVFFGKPRQLKAAILLPSGYFDHPERDYPICYRAAGLNGRYSAINNLMAQKSFTDWWFAKEAPQVMYVFLDSQGPYGDTYQMDSENNGPCGKALTEELIPAIEQQIRYKPETRKRYLCGASTGGWVSLGLQIMYPDFFDGTWSYSPDPVDFEHYGLINVYQDETIFYNKFGYLQPGRRTIYGEPTFSMKDWIAGENVNSRTGDYRISGGQFGAYNAVFGPRGADGLPSLMFDPFTGKIDHQIARQWEKYDLKKILEKNWNTLGPKLQGKLWIWTGDMDGLYSNVATRFLKMFLDKTTHPVSDAKISFTAMAGHTAEWNDKTVLQMVADKAAGK